MAVTLTVSETLDGSGVNDSLAGGGTGVDLGQVTNGQFAPLIDQSTNDGKQSLFVRHDATVDPITSVRTFIQEFGTGTGFTYGGADSATNDYSTLVAEGNTSNDSKNNADGNSSGLWIDMDADVSVTNQFDFATNGIGEGGNDTVAKYGDNNTDGIDLASAFTVESDAMVIDSDQSQGGDATNGFIPTAPVDGQIGIDGDTALGDNAHLKLRMYLRSGFPDGGIVQWEWVIAFSFTA